MSRRHGSVARAHLPSLKALRAFNSVARLGSMSLASDELSITPGAVSRHIRELETDLGVAILEREGRGLRLTTEGERLRNDIHPCFDMIDAAVRRICSDTHRRTLLIAAPPVFATNWLIPRLDRFAQQAPMVDVAVSDRFGECNATLAEADMVIDWGSFDSTTDVVAERLTQEEVFPVCGPSVCPEDGLAGAPLLHRHSIPRGFDFPDWPTYLAVVGRGGLGGIDPHAGLRLGIGLILNAAREGKGVALAITTVSHDDLVSGRLVRPAAEAMEIDSAYWLLTRKAVSDRPEVETFRAWLMDELAGSVGRPCLENSVP